MTHTYTVRRIYDTDQTAEVGLTLKDAAEALMTQDGFAFEIRPSTGGMLSLWLSDGSANSPRGARHMRESCCGWTEDQLYAWVILGEWHGFEAVLES